MQTYYHMTHVTMSDHPQVPTNSGENSIGVPIGAGHWEVRVVIPKTKLQPSHSTKQ